MVFFQAQIGAGNCDAPAINTGGRLRRSAPALHSGGRLGRPTRAANSAALALGANSWSLVVRRVASPLGFGRKVVLSAWRVARKLECMGGVKHSDNCPQSTRGQLSGPDHQATRSTSRHRKSCPSMCPREQQLVCHEACRQTGSPEMATGIDDRSRKHLPSLLYVANTRDTTLTHTDIAKAWGSCVSWGGQQRPLARAQDSLCKRGV